MLCLTEFLPANPSPLWALCRQLGVTRAIVKCAPELTGLAAPDNPEALAHIVHRFKDAGIEVVGLEGDQFDMNRIKRGLAGRDLDIQRYIRLLENMAALNIRLLCYNFMVGTGWHRSGECTGRGGARATYFRLSEQPAVAHAGHLGAEAVWDNYLYFISAVMPVAERLGIRMALHPDDPPVPSLSGIARIFTSPDAFDRAFQALPVRANSITFCQANFRLMGCELAAVARHFGERIAFVHVREVQGIASDFVERFHDENDGKQTDLFALYDTLGLDVPIRSDHVPTMTGDEHFGSHVPGYATLGRLFAIGYFKGLLDARGVAYR